MKYSKFLSTLNCALYVLFYIVNIAASTRGASIPGEPLKFGSDKSKNSAPAGASPSAAPSSPCASGKCGQKKQKKRKPIPKKITCPNCKKVLEKSDPKAAAVFDSFRTNKKPTANPKPKPNSKPAPKPNAKPAPKPK